MFSVLLRCVFVLLLFALLPACTNVLSSDDLSRPVQPNSHTRRSQSNMSYTLAKDLVLIRVRVEPLTARILVCAQAPSPVEDDRYQYQVVWRNSPFAADTIKLEKYPNTNIIQSLDVESLDQTDQFVFELAKSAGAVVGVRKEADATNECTEILKSVTLVDTLVDPADPADVRSKLAKMNRMAMVHVKRYADKCRDPVSPTSQQLDRGACEEYLRLYNGNKRHGFQPIQMRWTLPDVPPVQEHPDCSAGICYRPLLPFTLTVSVGHSSVASQVFALPNISPVIAMDVTRGIAITKTTKIGFDEHGQPTKFFIKKGQEDGKYGAEAVELAILPQTVINAYFGQLSLTLGDLNKSLSTPGATQITEADEALKWSKKLVWSDCINPAPKAGSPEEAACKKSADEDTAAQTAITAALAVKRKRDRGFLLSASNAAYTAGNATPDGTNLSGTNSSIINGTPIPGDPPPPAAAAAAARPK